MPASLQGLTDGPREAVLKAAWTAYSTALKKGAVAREGLLTIIDYTLPSTEPRLWVVDLLQGQVLYRELVAHGRASGHASLPQQRSASASERSEGPSE